MKKKQIKYYIPKSIKVNEDVWFYKNPKSFDFVVWTSKGVGRQCVQFRVRKSKLK
jgi:hypothetical protein